MLSANSPTQGNLDAAKAFMEYLGQPRDAGHLRHGQDPGNVAAAKDADTSDYTAAPEEGRGAHRRRAAITQFLDRDTNPNFAGPNGMQAFLLDFLKNPDQDLDAFHKEDPGLLGHALAARPSA